MRRLVASTTAGWRAAVVSSLLLVAIVANQAPAAFIVTTLGDQDFSDGCYLSVAAFNAASAGELAPFDRFKGGDWNSNFEESWTFNFTPGTYSSAEIEFGIYDSDGAAQGWAASYFGFDGNDLTGSNLFDGYGVGRDGQYNVHTLTLSQDTLDDLSDGSVTFTLILQRGLQGSTLTDFNGAGLDFATLRGEVFDDPSITEAAPEPASVAVWSLLCIVGFGIVRRRRRHT